MATDEGPRFYNDDGTEFNPDLMPVPDLCAICTRNGNLSTPMTYAPESLAIWQQSCPTTPNPMTTTCSQI